MAADIYIYLKGGRGDGFVAGWDGQPPTEADGNEKGEPYRNTIEQTYLNNGFGSLAGPGWQMVPSGGTSTTLTRIMDDKLTELNGTPTPPRSWTKVCTWLYFTATAGVFRFRKDLVIGWGTKART